MAEKVKIAIAALIAVAGMFAFYALVDRQPLVVRILVLAGAFAAAIAVMWFTEAGRTFLAFARESWEEAKRVVWPTRKETLQTTGVEMFRKLLDQGQAGDKVGVLLRGTKREEVERGQVLAKPGSITPHTKCECEVYVLSKEEGGRHTPFFNGYRPQFYFRTTDVTGSLELPAGTEMVMPGDNIKMTVTLIQPIAMEEKLRFAIREGGRTVGAGVVSKILE